jgi:imidazole glycerol-phosphate synthase subunit HisH
MSKPEITVIDYGVGNLLSVKRGFEHCGASVTLTSNPDFILTAKKIVLPGVGAFKSAMESLSQLKLIDPIRTVAQRGVPILGICLGMQLLMETSEEFGITKGLGLIPGNVVPIPNTTMNGEPHKIPHIGWNELLIAGNRSNWEDTLLSSNAETDSAYFVHSFMAMPRDLENRVANVKYGGHALSAVIARNRITGCQFHPEKSGEVGLKILRQFCFD